MARMSKLERMYKHVLESYLDRGYSQRTAESRAAATVNKRRSRLARRHRGPRLVTRGGSRRQWYPGKRAKRRPRFVCLEHHKRFRTRAALLAHYRSHRVHVSAARYARMSPKQKRAYSIKRHRAEYARREVRFAKREGLTLKEYRARLRACGLV